MKNYKVYMTEEITHILTVQADDPAQARELAHEYYANEGVGRKLRHEGITHTEIMEEL